MQNSLSSLVKSSSPARRSHVDAFGWLEVYRKEVVDRLVLQYPLLKMGLLLMVTRKILYSVMYAYSMNRNQIICYFTAKEDAV